MSKPRITPSSAVAPQLKHLFRMELAVRTIQDIGQTQRGVQRIAWIAGGTFVGERLSGEVLVGEDCIVERHDGTVEINVRLPLLTEDGQCILMLYRGYRHGPNTVMMRLRAGEDVDPGEYYFRVAASFEPPNGRYDWLGRIVAVGAGCRRASSVIYEMFEIT